MQHGDLQAWDQPRLVVILEGVLVDVLTDPPPKTRFWQRHSGEPAQYLHWHEVPLKRTVSLKRTYPDAGIDIVTFTSEEIADDAADFLLNIDAPIARVDYHKLRDWVEGLKFRVDVQTIYDSDDDRLDLYGQRGYKVIKGRDFG